MRLSPDSLLSLLLLPLAFASPTPALAVDSAAPPTDLEPLDVEVPKLCDGWSGTYEGNDTTSFELVLCVLEGGSVVGTARTWSPRSGESVMLVDGSQVADGFELRDSLFLVDEPNFPWEFCMSERYRLELTSDGGLVGWSRSTACNDASRIELASTGPCDPPSLD